MDIIRKSYFFIVMWLFFAVGPAQASGFFQASSYDVIVRSGQFMSQEEKLSYLILEARNFLAQNQYDEAGRVANHILESLDQSSVEARDILWMAKMKKAQVLHKINQ